MHGRRVMCVFLIGWFARAAVSARAELIFEDDLESGATCAWSTVLGGTCDEVSRLYAHSGLNLYQLDASSFDVLPIGGFNTGGPSITDIAMDRNDVMVGISLAKIWSIDVATGAASEIAAFDGASEGLTSLSFVPIPGSDAERLVAAGTTGNVYDVNPATGAIVLLGNYGLSNGSQIRSSGDIVSVRGLGTFATVTIGDVPSDPDFVARINTTTWAATPIGTLSTGYDKVVGLGYWRGTFFGFVDDGSVAGTGTVITIDPATGAGTPVQVSPFRWTGAGGATDAPIVD
jgi:hypothetical protein